MTVRDFPVRQIPAHELYGDFWLNSEPVPITALKGRVILLDFWDYTDCSSLRAMPYLNEWHKRYSQYGLVVVGVHTPKFPFGKRPDIVQRAIERLKIEYPVVMDNESMIWSSYGNHIWPTKHLIDKEGFVRCTVAGEGSYAAMEQVIHSLLYNAGVTEELPLVLEPMHDSDRVGAVTFRGTPELFAGYLRGSVGNIEGYSPESVVEYADPKIYFDGRLYLDGNWMNDRNSVRHQDDDREGQVIVNYSSLEVNAVIDNVNHDEFEVVVRQDDNFLSSENRGDDVLIETDGRSVMRIAEPKMYNVVKNKEFGEHVLRLSTRSNAFGLCSLAFVSGVIPEMFSNN